MHWPKLDRKIPGPTTNTAVDGFGGYWGTIDLNNHNYYEEYPSMRVLAEGLHQSMSDAANGICATSTAPEGLVVNTNLNGFRPLVINRRNEANKNLGITQNDFP